MRKLVSAKARSLKGLTNLNDKLKKYLEQATLPKFEKKVSSFKVSLNGGAGDNPGVQIKEHLFILGKEPEEIAKSIDSRIGGEPYEGAKFTLTMKVRPELFETKFIDVC